MPNDLISSPPLRDPVDGETGMTTPWSAWFKQAFVILFAVGQSGTTANRPTVGLWIGRPYFDTDLGTPIWWNGSGWVNATGASA